MITVDAPRPIDVPESGSKFFNFDPDADVDDLATVQNALEAAKESEGIRSDKEAFVEIAEAYTGWSP